MEDLAQGQNVLLSVMTIAEARSARSRRCIVASSSQDVSLTLPNANTERETAGGPVKLPEASESLSRRGRAHFQGHGAVAGPGPRSHISRGRER